MVQRFLSVVPRNLADVPRIMCIRRIGAYTFFDTETNLQWTLDVLAILYRLIPSH